MICQPTSINSYACMFLCINCFLFLCYCVTACLPFLFYPVSAVTPELRNAKLITREESEMLNDLSDLVGLQYSKSPEEMAKTADILRSYGFNGECKLLQGKLM